MLVRGMGASPFPDSVISAWDFRAFVLSGKVNFLTEISSINRRETSLLRVLLSRNRD